jgi:site-specific DNA-methyltransferase (adenine-specific)
MPQTPQQFNIIYADPPWCYHHDAQECEKNHYSFMLTEDICKLPVSQLIADDAVLFLWATYPNLPDAFKVITAWGFTYKTVAFTWVKQNRKNAKTFLGTGNWTRANAEICLLAIKGHPKRKSKGVKQIIIEPRREHSRKPDVARVRIVELMGDLPRIELFARQKKPGWYTWGNQISSDIQMGAVCSE